MASVAPSTDHWVMSPFSSFSTPAPGASDSGNTSPPSKPEAAIAKALVVRMPGLTRRHLVARGVGSSDRVRKNLVADRDISSLRFTSEREWRFW
jgi:hypothetical protein